MGMRFRRSINLGGGFRINLSGAGIGYSWGVKGFRLTKTSKGTTRMTASIPGTGISYVEETSAKNQLPADNNYYYTENIVNGTAAAMVSDGLEELLQAAKTTLQLNQIVTFCLWLSLILCLCNPIFVMALVFFAVLKFSINKYGRIVLDYCIDEDQSEAVVQRMKPVIQVAKSNKVWRIMQSSKVIDRKYTAGAAHTIKRTNCKATRETPFPFTTVSPVATFKAGNETLVFLPDKLFIIQGNKVGALNYCDIITSVHTTKFVESERPPTDSKIVGHTWQYVNKSGGPDRRFKSNRELPICLYGEIELKSAAGLNTIIMFSNVHLT